MFIDVTLFYIYPFLLSSACTHLQATFLRVLSRLHLVPFFFFIITRYPLCVCVCLTILLLPLRNNFYLLPPRHLPSLLTLLPAHPRPRRPCLYPRAFIKASLCVDVGWRICRGRMTREHRTRVTVYTDANEITLKRAAGAP